MDAKIDDKGIHRASTFRIGGFALNNVATNMYMFLMGTIAYYLTGFIGVAVVVATSFVTVMRIFDGVTDPFLGYVADKLDTRFGKNRPFMLVGNLIMLVTSFIMFRFSHLMPGGFRFVFFIIFYVIYVIGYTAQCIATKSAMACLTNDPKQRPTYAVYNGLLTTLTFTVLPWLFYTYLVPKHRGFTLDFFNEAWMYIAPISLVLTCIAVFSIAPKDRTEYFGTSAAVRVKFADYWDVLKNNRAIQTLVVSAGTDKLALQTRQNTTVIAIVFGIVCGNIALNGGLSAYTSIPTFIFIFFGAGLVSIKFGQKKAMIIGSIGGLVTCVLGFLLFYIGDPTTFQLPGIEGYERVTFFTVAFMAIWILMSGFNGITSNIIFPMLGDVADYEVYRSGKYVPGMIGALFSFVDKLISSFASTIVGIMCLMIGFSEELPTVDTAYSDALKFVGVFCLFGIVAIGLVANIIAMKFYPLTKEKMEEIQDEIVKIKKETQVETK